MKARRFLWLALLLIGAGYFGPWVWHKAAGLNLSADDLGEWIKFLPAWKSSQLPVMRELFYLPIWLVSIGSGLMAGHITAWPWKWVVLAVSLLLVLTPLPKYPELLSAYREPDFMLTFWATVAALMLSVILAFFGARLPARMEAALWIAIGIAAALFAPWMFGRAMPDIASRNPALRMAAERTAINTPIQGTAADLIKAAMIRVHKRLASDARGSTIILQIHDELLLESPAGRVEVVPMSPIRRKTAEHMVLSKRTSAHVATVFEVDLTRVEQLRQKHRAAFEHFGYL